MEHYISKSALVAEIERIEHETNYEPFTDEVLVKRCVCRSLLSFINTIEAKDVEELDINEVCKFLDGYSFIPTYVINELRNEFLKEK